MKILNWLAVGLCVCLLTYAVLAFISGPTERSDPLTELQQQINDLQKSIESLEQQDPEINIEVVIPEEAIQIELDAEAFLEEKRAVKTASAEPEYKTFEATAYTADCTGCIGITKTGVDVRNNTRHEGKRIIAVDPNIIPLGSVVELKLSDGTTFEATAQDTGGAINGYEIDLLMGSREKAIQFGRQDIELRILRRGGPR